MLLHMRETRESGSGPGRGHERKLVRLYGGPVAGIDEAGRGPWAGPVVAAAVILDTHRTPPGLNDSKKLRASEREALYAQLQSCAVVGVGIAEVDRIDRDNILAATLWAMAQAVSALSLEPACAMVDGNRCPDLPCPAQSLIKGDALASCIAAASIVAKVTRDRIMADLARSHPAYGWERNKGYGTREHAHALARHGVTPHHRRSFRPVQAALAQTVALEAG